MKKIEKQKLTFRVVLLQSKIPFSIILLFSYLNFWSQNLPLELDRKVTELFEQNVDSEQDVEDFSDHLSKLNYYLVHPLNLNTAGAEDLSELLILNSLEIQAVVDYRIKMKEFVDIDELIFVGIDKEKVELLRNFIFIGAKEEISIEGTKKILQNSENQLLMRCFQTIEKSNGYLKDTLGYLGSRQKYWFRYTGNVENKLSWGLTGEKDAGEQFYKGDNKFGWRDPLAGFDHRAGYLALKSRKILKYTVLGTYSLQLGQGLCTWSGLALGKSVFSIQAKKTGNMIRPYAAANENSYLRGVATIFELKNITFLPYVSLKKIDVSSSGDSLLTSIQASGLHRTASEISNENRSDEVFTGLFISRKIEKVQVNLHSNILHYSDVFEPKNQLYQKYQFSGNQIFTQSFSCNYSSQSLQLFNEFAIQSNGFGAGIIGVILPLSERIKFMSVIRKYGVGYYAPYGNAFGENSRNQNEEGLFNAFEFIPSRNWTIRYYIDVYRSPWWKYRVSKPSQGLDFQLQVEQNMSDNFSHYGRLKFETSERDIESKHKIAQTGKWQQLRLRYHQDLKINYHVSFSNRLEINRFNFENISSAGYFLSSDIKYNAKKINCHFSSRFAIFETPNFQTAIYSYENDVLYSFSIPSYAGKGSRFYLLGQWKINSKLTFWIRYARWIYENVDSISSGNDQITGHRKSDFHLQMMYLF